MTPQARLRQLAWQFGPPLLTLVLVLSVWQGAISLGKVSAFVLPSPLKVLAALQDNLMPLVQAAWSTGVLALEGFLLSLVTGILLAFLMAQARFLERSLFPYAIFLQTVPIIAIAPLLIYWCGPTPKAIVLVSFIISLFPIVTNATTGLANPPREWLELLRLYHANWWAVLLKVRIPAAIPYIITGAKVSAGLSVVGAIVGEYFTGTAGRSHGLAYLILVNSENLRIPYLFATTIMAAVLGLLIFSSVSLVGNGILRLWHFRHVTPN